MAVVCTLLGSAAVTSAIFNSILLSLPLCASSLALLAILARRSAPRGASAEHDMLRFTSNLLNNWSEHTDTVKIIENSLDKSFAFSDDIGMALLEYRSIGDAVASFNTVTRKYPKLSHIAQLLALKLDTGITARAQLEQERSGLVAAHDRRLRGIALSSNATAITNAGSVVFFPAFAGISLGIIRATSISGQQAGLFSSLIVVFAGYILITLTIGARYSQGTILAKIARISALSSLSLLILRLCSSLQIGAI